MPNNNSLYGSVTNTGSVSSQNYTTLYSSSTAGVANGNLTVDGTLTVNGCAILTNCTTFDLLPTTATTINFGLAATALNIGANTGVTLINNQLATANYTFPVADGVSGQVLVTDGAGTVSFAPASTVGKTYSIDSTVTTGGANFNLVSSDPSTDTIKFANGTGVTVTATSASEISIAIGQDVATTASPQFLGATLGNITVGIVDDNTISTTTGDLYLTSDNNQVVIGPTSDLVVSDDIILGDSIVKTVGGDTLTIDNSIAFAQEGWQLILENTTNNQIKYPLVVTNEITGGALANGGGTGIKYSAELGGPSLLPIGSTEFVAVDVATNNYDFVVQKRNPASLPDQLQEILRVTNNSEVILGITNDTATAIGIGGRVAGNDYWHIGGYSISGTAGNDGALEIAVANNGSEPIFVRQYTSGGTTGQWPYGNTILRTLTLLGSSGETILPVSLTLNGSSSGSSTFAAPATGSTLSYVLPGTAGAANTVLTNDGSGNLTWALPGGGGSTFGNVSIGVVTDNTISTTSGDLDITSTTGVINLDTYTTLTDGRLTTTSVSTVTLDSFAVATYQNATYFINVKDAVTGDIQSTKVDIMHNGTTAYINQYANMTTTADLSTFAATISGGNVLLEITPASTNSTQFTFSRTALRV